MRFQQSLKVDNHARLSSNGLFLLTLASFVFLLIAAGFVNSIKSSQAQTNSPDYSGPGNALDFGGTNDYVSYGDLDQLDGAEKFTIMLWVKTHDLNHSGDLVSKDNHGNNSSILFWRDESGHQTGHTNTFSVLVSDGSDDARIEGASGQCNDKEWHHVAVTFNGGKPDGLRLYVDGVEDPNSPSSTNNISQIESNSNPLTLGEAPVSGNNFNGIIDEFRIWEGKVLTKQQIQDFMCKAIDPGEYNNLIGYWYFNQDSGTTLQDSSSQDNNGTLKNFSMSGSSSNWVTSGAPVGNSNKSKYGNDTLIRLNHPTGDSFKVKITSGNPQGIHIYRVDEAPNVTTPPNSLNQLSTVRYWGVEVIGGNNPTYDITYYYNGHPGFSSSKSYKLALAKRANNASANWQSTSYTLDTGNKTLTLKNQTGTEYILGTSSNDPLPVELMYFKARKKDGKAQLAWATASETSNAHFIIQRSDNGEDFYRIGKRFGYGNSTKKRFYNFTDEKDFEGVVYYRLKQVDFDGSFNYSSIKAIKEEKEKINKLKLVNIYPNPFTNKLNLALKKNKDFSNLRIHIFDMEGKRVFQKAFSISGKSKITLENPDIPKGQYFIRGISGNYEQFTRKIVKK